MMFMNKSIMIGIIAAVVAISAYYASPLFINTTVDEPLPSNIAMSEEMMMSDEEMPMPLLAGSFIGAGDGIHNAEGSSKVFAVQDGQSEKKLLRFENFNTTNGPDLYVYLSKDDRSISEGYVNLGRLKGNMGNQNYEIPVDVDLGEYRYVLIWCQQFSVLFGYAELQSA